jgi:hypothetical protein
VVGIGGSRAWSLSSFPSGSSAAGGRKHILAPDNSAITPTSKPQPDGTLVKALARAWRWQKLLDDGLYTSVTEISEAEQINKSYVSRILRVALLPPDVVEAILAGTTNQRMMLEQLEGPLPASWEAQLEHLRREPVRSISPLPVSCVLNPRCHRRTLARRGRPMISRRAPSLSQAVTYIQQGRILVTRSGPLFLRSKVGWLSQGR